MPSVKAYWVFLSPFTICQHFFDFSFRTQSVTASSTSKVKLTGLPESSFFFALTRGCNIHKNHPYRNEEPGAKSKRYNTLS